MENNSFANSRLINSQRNIQQDLQSQIRNIQTQEKFLLGYLIKKCKQGKYFLHLLLTISAIILILSFSSACFFHFPSGTTAAAINKGIKLDNHVARQIRKTQEIYHNSHAVSQSFRKIFWILIQDQFEGLSLYDYLQVMNQKHYAESSGYEVRIVDPITIFDWIPEAKARRIAEIKMKSQISIDIVHILRLMLMLEHGGVTVFKSNYIFTDKLVWINRFFEQNQPIQTILFYKNISNTRVYQDHLIISKKNSALIRTVYSYLLQYIQTGYWQYQSEYSFGQYKNESQIIVLQNPISNLVNFLSNFRYSAQQFDLQFRTTSLIKQNKIMKSQNFDDIFKVKSEFKTVYPNSNILELPLTLLKDKILKILSSQSEVNTNKNSIFMQDIIQIPGNEWLWQGINPARKVNFCIISLKSLTINYQKQIATSIQQLKKQHFTNWKAIYFVEELKEQKKTYSNFPSITLVRSAQYQGLNLQRAATKQCEHHDIAILLDYDEFLGEQKSLSTISAIMSTAKYYAALLTIKTVNKIQQPKVIKFIPRRINKPNRQLLYQLSNNMRIFSISTYKLIQRGQLKDFVDGRFYDKELVLLAMVQMGANINQCMNNQFSYQLKKKQHEGHSIPREIAPTINTWIIAQSLKQSLFKQRQYMSKFSHSICHHFQNSQLGKSVKSNYPFHRHFIYNNGKQFFSIDDRKSYPPIIAKNIHQIRLAQEQLHNNKPDLSKMLKNNHKDYKYFLWTKQNITRNNFPITFNLLQNILHHPSQGIKRNRNILLSDLMRLQILHNHGGFYIDNSYYVFNKSALDIFLTYKFVFPSYLIPHHRQFRENSLIGAEKGCRNIKNLLDYRLLSSRNIFDLEASRPYGPRYFSQAASPEQQYNEDILQPPYQFVYPYSPQYSDDNRNLCLLGEKDEISEVILRGKFNYSKDCPQKYYWAFGINLFKEGDKLIYWL